MVERVRVAPSAILDTLGGFDDGGNRDVGLGSARQLRPRSGGRVG